MRNVYKLKHLSNFINTGFRVQGSGFSKNQHRGPETKTILLLLLLSLLIFSACRLPRIIVLDDPLTPEEHLNLGVAYEKNNETDAAIKEYRLSAGKLPLAYLYLGNAYFQKNELDDAEKYYKMAVEKLPGNADALNNLAWLYYKKKINPDEAEGLALKAIELDPSKEAVYRDTLDKIRELKKAAAP